jgi:pimeloyl-ACP methyl ester carboxylesterase
MHSHSTLMMHTSSYTRVMAVHAVVAVLSQVSAQTPDTASLFQYDAARLPPLACEAIAKRTDVQMHGCSFAGPRGGRVNLVLVSPPRAVRPPYAAVLFQHGGGQSMSNYVSEAMVLARTGVVSMITDAPARGEGVNSDVSQTKLTETQRFQADVVIALRMALDQLIRQPGVDPNRIAYVGHSYGGIAGGTLSGIEPRIRALALLGAVASYADHIRTNASPYWKEMRERMTPGEFTRTLELLSETDPARYLPLAKAPVLVQCARWDTPDNVAACPAVAELAAGPKRLVWYEDDHNFTSWEAARDRLHWFARHLRLKGIDRAIRDLLSAPAGETRDSAAR